MSICFICEQSTSEDEKPVGARGRQTLLTASVTRSHSDHKKIIVARWNRGCAQEMPATAKFLPSNEKKKKKNSIYGNLECLFPLYY
jgi:hypothetical protein